MKYQLRTTDEVMSDIAILADLSQLQPAEVLAPLVAVAVAYAFFYEGLIHKLGNNNKFWSTLRRVLPFVDDVAREHGFYASYGVDKIEHVGTIKMQERDAVQILYGKGFIDNPIAAHKTDWADRKEIASLAHYGYDGETIRSWGKLKRFLMMTFVIRKQLHVTLFKRKQGEIIVTAHHEYSPYNALHAYDHFRGNGYDERKGVEMTAEKLADCESFVLGE